MNNAQWCTLLLKLLPSPKLLPDHNLKIFQRSVARARGKVFIEGRF
jgi:hypothetical protein